MCTRRRDPLYRVYRGIKTRCYNPNSPDYQYYGSKDVVMCDEWLNDFDVFSKWCHENNWIKGLHISRDGDIGNYSPDNCKIKTLAENIGERNSRVSIVPIIGINIKTDEIIEFKSITSAVNFINGDQSCISKALNGKRKTHKGYIWNYKKESDT